MEAQLQLVKTTARHVRCFLDQAMDSECNGCLVNHPSQLQHECLMLDGEDHIRFCLDRALLLVDWENVKNDFVQSYPQSNFRDKNWFQTLWADDIWYDQLVSALLAQEWLSESKPNWEGYIFCEQRLIFSQQLTLCGGRTNPPSNWVCVVVGHTACWSTVHIKNRNKMVIVG